MSRYHVWIWKKVKMMWLSLLVPGSLDYSRSPSLICFHCFDISVSLDLHSINCLCSFMLNRLRRIYICGSGMQELLYLMWMGQLLGKIYLSSWNMVSARVCSRFLVDCIAVNVKSFEIWWHSMLFIYSESRIVNLTFMPQGILSLLQSSYYIMALFSLHSWVVIVID